MPKPNAKLAPSIALLLATSLAGSGCTATNADHRSVDTSVAIGTFNIRYANSNDGNNAWQYRSDLVTAILQEGDIWGLQEALPQQVDALRQSLPDFQILTRSRDVDPTRGEACPLLFRKARWQLDQTDCGTFWLSTTPDEIGSRGWDAALPRIVTFARLLDRQTGRALYVYNAHFDHRGANARLESARLLSERIAARKHQDPVVVLGDFNTGPTTAPVRALTESSNALVDAWRIQHAGEPERGTFNGWRESVGTSRIDYILVSQGADIEACWIDARRPEGRWPSDHLPVRASLRLRGH